MVTPAESQATAVMALSDMMVSAEAAAYLARMNHMMGMCHRILAAPAWQTAGAPAGQYLHTWLRACQQVMKRMMGRCHRILAAAACMG